VERYIAEELFLPAGVHQAEQVDRLDEVVNAIAGIVAVAMPEILSIGSRKRWSSTGLLKMFGS
jgi:hypothetical protein